MGVDLKLKSSKDVISMYGNVAGGEGVKCSVPQFSVVYIQSPPIEIGQSTVIKLLKLTNF